MSAYFYLLSSLSFLISYGIFIVYTNIRSNNPMLKGRIMEDFAHPPFNSRIIPYMSAFILPVFPLIKLLSWHWVVISLVNAILMVILSLPVAMIIKKLFIDYRKFTSRDYYFYALNNSKKYSYLVLVTGILLLIVGNFIE